MGKTKVTMSSAVLACALGLGFSLNASAVPANFSFTGSFTADDNIQLFGFTTDGSSTVRLISYSYGGGTQSNGNVVSAGGFDPILALFDSTGGLVGQNDDSGSGCGSGVVSADPSTGEEFDTCIDLPLAAGNYTVAVMQYDNFAIGPNFSDGFFVTASPTFTAVFGCSNGQFCDFTGDNRNNFWAFDILNVEQAALIPAPATLALLGLGLAGLGLGRRRRAS